jgi:protein TonB
MRPTFLAVALFALAATFASGQEVSGTTMPKVLKMVKPVYTPEGRAAKIQGTVQLSAVVRPDGTVTDVKVVRSLDTKFGLDAQAVIATQQWTFTPGTRDGKPVPVTVMIEQSFYLNSTK